MITTGYGPRARHRKPFLCQTWQVPYCSAAHITLFWKTYLSGSITHCLVSHAEGAVRNRWAHISSLGPSQQPIDGRTQQIPIQIKIEGVTTALSLLWLLSKSCSRSVPMTGGEMGYPGPLISSTLSFIFYHLKKNPYICFYNVTFKCKTQQPEINKRH